MIKQKDDKKPANPSPHRNRANLGLVCILAVAILCVIACVSIIDDSAETNSAKVDGGVEWELVNNNVLTFRPAANPEAGYQPGQMKDYTGLAQAPWYVYMSKATALDIQNGVTHIGGYAFYQMFKFTEINIPDCVTSIGDGAFLRCHRITGDITIGSGLNEVGEGAFGCCTGEKFIVNSNNQYFKANGKMLYSSDGKTIIACLINQTGTWSSLISDDVTKIGDYAFALCKKISGDLAIGDKITYIGSHAFYETDITHLSTIGTNVTEIGSHAFSYCQKMTGTLDLPTTLTTIGDHAFSDCYGLSGDINIPDSVTYVGPSAFESCRGFHGTLKLSSNMTSIGTSTFKSCGNLTGSLTIPNSIKSIGDSAFYYCHSLTGTLMIPDSVESIGTSSFSCCSGFTGDLYLPNSIKSIPDYAFNECTGMTANLYIPSSVTTIGYAAFYGDKFIGNLIIPDSVTWVGDHAFHDCTEFSKLVLSNNLTSIGTSSFRGCTNLSGDLIIPDKVTYIAAYAFRDCPGFDGRLVIGPSVKTIYSSFSGTNGFNDVTFFCKEFDYSTSSFEINFYKEDGVTKISQSSDLCGYEFKGNYEKMVRQGEVVQFNIVPNNSEYGAIEGESKISITVPKGTSFYTSNAQLTIAGKVYRAIAKYPGDHCTYAFDHWDITSGSATNNMTVTAVFKKNIDQYNVGFVVNESGWGSVSPSSVSVSYGSQIVASGDTLVIDGKVVTATPALPTLYYVYDFDHWGIEPGQTVTGDMEITAYFTRVDKPGYTVSIFPNNPDWGSVSLEAMNVPVGSLITVSGDNLVINGTVITATPALPSSLYVYDFDRWNITSEVVTQDTMVMAIFTQTAKPGYNVTFVANDSEYGSISPSVVNVPSGSIISVSGDHIIINGIVITATPALPTSLYVYDFDHWDTTGGTVTKDMTIKGIFTKVAKPGYNITFAVNDSDYGSVSPTIVNAPYGSIISVSGDNVIVNGIVVTATPALPTSAYVYDFDHWDISDYTVTSDMVITAVFSATEKQGHNVTFAVNDSDYGSVSPTSVNVPDGSVITVSGDNVIINGIVITATPALPTSAYVYDFDHWDIAEGTVTSDMTITAVFSATPKTGYNVTFAVNDSDYGSVSPMVVNVPSGSSITVNGCMVIINGTVVTATPALPTSEYIYAFDHWDTTGGTVTSDMTITATFTRESKTGYNVTFTVNDSDYGSVSPTTLNVPYGSIITVSENIILVNGIVVTATPTLPSSLYVYEFDHWEISDYVVTRDMTITAIFTETSKTGYNVTFTVNDSDYGSVSPTIVNVASGSVIVVDGNTIIIDGIVVTATPALPTSDHLYIFDHWDTTGGLVTRDMVIRATFVEVDAVCTVTFSTDSTPVPEPVTVAYGSKISEPNVSKDGYILIGWYNGDKLWRFSTDVVTEDMTLVAKWQVIDVNMVIEVDIAGERSITIPADSIVRSITVTNGQASVYIPEESLDAIKRDGGKLYVELKFINSKDSFEIVVLSGESEFNGRMIVSLPYDTTQKNAPKVFWIHDGIEEKMSSVYLPSDGLVIFETNHNSTYVVKYVDESSSTDNVGIIIFIVVLIVVFAVMLFAIVLHHKKA